MTPIRDLLNSWRIQAVADTGLLQDLGLATTFDPFVHLAAVVLQSPIALFALVTNDRQVVESQEGLPADALADLAPDVQAAMGRYVVAQGGPVEIADVRGDANRRELWCFRHTGAVAYLGVPVRDDQGFVVGVLEVLDYQPRAWSPAEIEALTAVASAITSEVRARKLERKLALANAAKHAVLESIADYVALHDRDFRYVFVNEYGAELLGRPAQEVLGQSLWDVVPELVGTDTERQYRRAMVEHAVTEFEHFSQTTGRWFQVCVYPAADGLVVMAHEITAERRVQADLREAERHKSEAMTRMAGAVAHDVNNLLTAVQGITESILASHVTDELRTDLEYMRRATERPAALAQKLLAYSRRQMLQPELTDLNVFVGEVLDLRYDLAHAGIIIATDVSEGIGRVQVDRLRLEQAVNAIIDNAIEAMPGGGTLTVSTAHTQIALDSFERGELPPGPYVLLRLADTGRGMSEEQQKRIFEPFFSTKDPRSPSSGLGLAFVQGFVEQSHGGIWIASSPGLGTEVRVYLPELARPVQPEVPVAAGLLAKSPVPMPAVARPVTVLVVDDDPLILKLAVAALSQAGFRVLQATNGVQALAIAGREPSLEVLVTDVIMPRMGGVALADQLRAARPDLAVLFMSGYTQEVIPDRLKAGSVAFLPKPYASRELVEAVLAVMGKEEAAG